MLDNVLTLLLFGQVGALMAGLWNQSTWMLAEYVGYGVGSLLAGQSFKTLFQWLGPRIAMQQEARGRNPPLATKNLLEGTDGLR